MPRTILPGKPYPLGARFDGRGVNFAIHSESATRIEVCLFDAVTDRTERERILLSERTMHVHHGYVPGLAPGAAYGFRAHGPWRPEEGHRFNANKLLVDPYARAVGSGVDWRAPLAGAKRPKSGDDGGATRDDEDSAWGAPKSVVVDESFNWEGDRLLDTPWEDTVFYEAHVKGMTMLHPDVPKALRGTYAGLATPPILQHLKRLGVTAIELLPVQEFVDERPVSTRGLVNYWGYNTLGYFAPAGRYAASGVLGQQVSEFKRMVKAFHEAKIEVILDVVYNHTAEGDHFGPTLFLRGLDNRSYYRLDPKDPLRNLDFTGCGNSLDARHSASLLLVMDSLRYWVTEMHVDGFRFDLATTLGRESPDFDRGSAFFDILHQDPVLSRVKLIAEPWDLGAGGYQVGGFPVPWAEWNGKYRDWLRRFWKGQPSLAEMGYRLTGSSDLYELGGRSPLASVNFVTAHDGFTLADLVAYENKHNEANGENNRDGSDSNDSDNLGVEGPTADPKVLLLREKQRRNLLTTLMVSQGVPMLCAGDELGKTQGGNNNAYCQDNAISWLDWNLDPERAAFLEFTQKLVAFRRTQPVLRRKRFFSGGRVRESEFKDVVWFRSDGKEMAAEDWAQPEGGAIGILLAGDAIPSVGEDGKPITGDTLLVLCNAEPEPRPFVLPAIEWGERWEIAIDTRSTATEGPMSIAGSICRLEGRSMVVMRLVTAAG